MYRANVENCTEVKNKYIINAIKSYLIYKNYNNMINNIHNVNIGDYTSRLKETYKVYSMNYKYNGVECEFHIKVENIKSFVRIQKINSLYI